MIDRILSVLLVLAGLGGCAADRFEVVQLPERAADLYPGAQARGPVAMVADAVVDPERSRQYFGVDLPGQGILPVILMFSNHSDGRYVVRPSDILLQKNDRIIDPLPVEYVAALAKDALWRLDRETAQRIDGYFEAQSLRETVLSGHASHQGVLFFPVRTAAEERDPFFRTISLFGNRSLKLHAAVTDWQRHTREHFGPFYLPEPE